MSSTISMPPAADATADGAPARWPVTAQPAETAERRPLGAVGPHPAEAAAQAQSRALARWLELPVLGGNRVRAWGDMAAAWDALVDVVTHATDHVHVAGWPPSAPDAQRLSDVLLQACRRGVRVHVLRVDDEQADGAACEPLRGAGARLCQ